MPEITAEMVRSLRDKTDLPMMECKKALNEAGGDEEKAIQILREKVKGLQVKLSDRATGEGRVATMAAADGSAAVMVEMMCETAPVAKNEDFLFLIDQLCKQLLTGPGAANAEELLKQTAPDRPGVTLQSLLDDIMNKIRENMKVGRILKVKGPAGAYTHHDGTVGVLFEAAGSSATAPVLKDVAMHVAAMLPKYTHPEELDPAAVAAEKARLSEEARKSGKPENIIEKMVLGKLRVFYDAEKVLVAQPFAKDDSKTVEKALDEAGLKAVRFTRWRLGQ